MDAADEVRAWSGGARPSQLIHVLSGLFAGRPLMVKVHTAGAAALLLLSCSPRLTRLSPPGAGFAVDMPEPWTQSVATAIPEGAQGPAVSWCNSAGPNLAKRMLRHAFSTPSQYCVSNYQLVLPVLGDAQPRILDRIRDETVSGIRPGSVSEILVERDDVIERDGHAGREFRLSSATGTTLVARAFVASDRVYVLWVLGGSEQVGSRAASSFLDSFSILEPPKRNGEAG